MIPVLELGYKFVAPSIMRRLVELLTSEYGFTQVEAAEKLGISQSAASRYLRRERGASFDVRRVGELELLLRDLALRIAAGKLDPREAQAEITKTVLLAMRKRYVCSFHASLDPEADPLTCTICPELFASIVTTK